MLKLRSLKGVAFIGPINDLKIIIVICLFFCLLAVIPDQLLELYRFGAQTLAQGYQDHSKLEGFRDAGIALTFISLLSLSFVLISMFFLSESTQAAGTSSLDLEARLVISIIGCLPSVAVGVGWIRATVDVTSADLRSKLLLGAEVSFARDFNAPDVVKELASFVVDAQLAINSWLKFGGIVFIVLGFLLFFISLAIGNLYPYLARLLRKRPKSLFWGPLAFLVIVSIVIAFYPVAIGRTLTSFGIICLFFIVMTFVLGALAIASIRKRIPLFSITVGAALFFALLGLNDNHSIREAQRQNRDEVHLSVAGSVAQGFTKWFENRKDRDRYQLEPYPVYIFTAEGGGIYAAHRTAIFLTSLQDLCPRFAHHVFAISAVSGGSVGAGIYSALIKKIKNDDKRFSEGNGCIARKVGSLFYTDVAEAILSEDFLSPVLASFLFPDLLQRFLFFPVPYFDRARALERSLEESWSEKTLHYQNKYHSEWVDAGNPLSEGFFSFWDPKSDVPALFINTTEVASGRGRVIAPFPIEATQFTSFPIPLQTAHAANEVRSLEMPLSSSVILSARFPWITPPGWFYNVTEEGSASGAAPRQSGKVHLVDGGYFDNSGVITALRVIEEIEGAVRDMKPVPRLQINLIVLTTAGSSDPASAVGDYLSPLETLLSTRYARGRIAIEQAEQFLNEKKSVPQSGVKIPPLEKMELRAYGFPLPLGWRLSPITRLLILGENGDPSRCPKSEDRTQQGFDRADCLRANVVRAMRN